MCIRDRGCQETAGQNRDESGVSTSSASTINGLPSASGRVLSKPNSTLVSASRMPRSAAISLPRLRIAMVRSRTRSATGIPISAATSSNVIGSSCARSGALVDGVKIGEHDEPMTFDEVAAEIGMPVAERVRDLTIAILKRGNEIDADRGILLAASKVEFGFDRRRPDADGYPLIVLADEVLTPDSSRFLSLIHI